MSCQNVHSIIRVFKNESQRENIDEILNLPASARRPSSWIFFLKWVSRSDPILVSVFPSLITHRVVSFAQRVIQPSLHISSLTLTSINYLHIRVTSFHSIFCTALPSLSRLLISWSFKIRFLQTFISSFHWNSSFHITAHRITTGNFLVSYCNTAPFPLSLCVCKRVLSSKFFTTWADSRRRGHIALKALLPCNQRTRKAGG